MSATPARIGFISSEFRHVVAVTPSVESKYGNLARKSEEPIETFFENLADAQAAANERQTMLSGDRRRFRANVIGVSEALALTYSGVAPVARYIDEKCSVDRNMIVSDIIIDLNKQACSFLLWG